MGMESLNSRDVWKGEKIGLGNIRWGNEDFGPQIDRSQQLKLELKQKGIWVKGQ